jgi:hypothetical protein
MSIYTHAGPFVPRTGVEWFQERIEQQLAWEDKYYGSFGSDLGEEDEASTGVFFRDGRMGEVDLGGILAQPCRDLQREGDG